MIFFSIAHKIKKNENNVMNIETLLKQNLHQTHIAKKN